MRKTYIINKMAQEDEIYSPAVQACILVKEGAREALENLKSRQVLHSVSAEYQRGLNYIVEQLDNYLVDRVCKTGTVTEDDLDEAYSLLEKEINASYSSPLREDLVDYLARRIEKVQGAMVWLSVMPLFKKEVEEKRRIPYELVTSSV